MHDQHAAEGEHSSVPFDGEEESRVSVMNEAETPYFSNGFVGGQGIAKHRVVALSEIGFRLRRDCRVEYLSLKHCCARCRVESR